MFRPFGCCWAATAKVTRPGPPLKAKPTEKYLRSGIIQRGFLPPSPSLLSYPIPICCLSSLPASPLHRRRAMPPPAGLLPWPSPSTTRLTTPTPTRHPPRTTRVRPPLPPPPPPYTRVRLPPPPPPTTPPPPPPRLEPAAPKPTTASTPLPPSASPTASSSSTCLDCVHFGKYVLARSPTLAPPTLLLRELARVSLIFR